MPPVPTTAPSHLTDSLVKTCSVVVGCDPNSRLAIEAANLSRTASVEVTVTHDLNAFVDSSAQHSGPVIAAFDRDILNRMALTKVKSQKSNLVRIAVLPPGAEQSVNDDCGYAHHFLLSEVLCSSSLELAILRAAESSSAVRMKAMQSLMPDSVELPPTPEGLAELLTALEDPTASMGDIAGVIEKDPVIAARTLQLANSAYFALPRRVTNLQQAVNLLGLQSIKSLALATKCMSGVSAKPNRLVDKCIDRVRKNGLAASQLIRKMLGPRGDGSAITAAVLHDIGQAVLMLQHGRSYEAILKKAEDQDLPLCRLEEEAFGVSHAEVGGSLLALWGLPPVLVEAVAFSHSMLPHPSQGASPLATVFLATALSEESRRGLSETTIPTTWAEACGFTGKTALQQWWDAAGEIQMQWPGA